MTAFKDKRPAMGARDLVLYGLLGAGLLGFQLAPAFLPHI